jgi:hypothetical protein
MGFAGTAFVRSESRSGPRVQLSASVPWTASLSCHANIRLKVSLEAMVKITSYAVGEACVQLLPAPVNAFKDTLALSVTFAKRATLT